MFCQRLGAVSFLALFSSLQAVLGQYIGDIQYPSGNNSYNIIDTVIVQWNSSVFNAASLDPAFSNPVLFTWFLDLATYQVEQVSQVDVPQTGTLAYNFQNYSSDLTLPPQESVWWFNLFYNTSVVASPNQEGFNGKVFSVYSNGNAAPTTWDLTTSFAGSPTPGAPSPTGTTPGTTPTIGTSGTTSTTSTTSTTTQTSSPTGTCIPQPSGDRGLTSTEKALIAAISIITALSVAVMFLLVRTRKHLHALEKLRSSSSSRSQRTEDASANVFVELSDSGRGRRGISGGGSDVLSTTGKTETNETVITYF